MAYRKTFSSFIKWLINFIISYPRLTVLLPTILIFTISYNVTYDYTIKEINGRIASYFGSDIISTDYSNVRLNNLIGLLNDDNPENLTLTTFEFSNKNIQQKQNALTFELLNEMKNIHVNLTNKCNDILIISPLSSWSIDWNIDGQEADKHKLKFNNSILRVINSKNYIQMDSLLINNINKINHLITSCELIKFYIVHHPDRDIKGSIFKATNDSTYLETISVSSTTNIEDLITFVNYSRIQNGSSSVTNLFFSLTSGTEIFVLMVFILYILIAIANHHKIRSNGGLTIAWVVEVLISGGASINILDYCHNYKSRASEHLTAFTAGAYIFTIMVVSSRNLFRIINDLASDDYVNNSHIHKKLYKFYLGISNNDKDNDASLKQISSFLNSYKIGRMLQQYFCSVPTITKVLMIDIVFIAILKILGLYLFSFSLNSPFKDYLTTRLSYFLEATCIALIIDHFLQLTYLVGIIIIDLKRYDLTDLLNYQTFQRNESLILPNNNIEGNFLSCFLLKLNYPSHLRPSRSSFRYKMGEYLLKVRYSTSLTTWVVILPLIESVYLLGIFMNWRMILPYKVISGSKGIDNMTTVNILNDETDCIFYLEYLCILVFIVVVSSLTFKLTHSDSLDRKSIKIDESDFELEDKNIFKCINLINSQDGHNLDVLKIIANSNSSFIVSVGLDHKILIWSPLINPILKPINISTTICDGKDKEFWPINHINISNDGGYIILINYKNKLIKCFERKKLNYSWQCELPPISSGSKIKVLESFFRKRTVPGFLSRKILQQQKSDKINRRGSAVSLSSMNSNMNGNFPFPMNTPELSIMMQSINESRGNEGQSQNFGSELEKQLNRDDFIMVLETGELITISCHSGELKTFDIFASVYNSTEGKKLNSVKKLFTPRVNDRVICHVNNYDIIVASIINNTWKFKILKVHEGYYNKGIHFSLPPPMSASNSLNETNDFSSLYKQERTNKNNETCEVITNSKMQINRATIVTVEFVGMIIRVNNLVAELIDMQGGIVLKRFHVGRFKPLTFKVSHLEPTHCKFCGSVSIQSFSILYEDYDKNTIIVHTFKIDANRSKNNICLRVERDPREIRCLGFSSVSEQLFWYENVECWQLTDINMIIGIKKKCIQQEEDMEIVVEAPHSSSGNIGTLIENSGLQSLRSRKHKNPKPKSNEQFWEGFIVTLVDGNLLYYQIPSSQTDSLIVNKVTCSEKFGYKSMVMNFGNLIKIIYLGNDKLIENDIYYSGSTTRSLPLPTNNLKVSQLNHDLLFINKRSRHSNLHKS